MSIYSPHRTPPSEQIFTRLTRSRRNRRLTLNHHEQGLAASPTAASFVRPARPRDAGQSFLSALKEKYLPQHQQDGSSETTQIRISGTKVAEEVGFDKVWKKLAQVRDLKIVILDCMRIAVARRDGDEAIGAACPSIVHVDLSRNLFDNIGPVVQICAELPHLRKLSIR